MQVCVGVDKKEDEWKDAQRFIVREDQLTQTVHIYVCELLCKYLDLMTLTILNKSDWFSTRLMVTPS